VIEGLDDDFKLFISVKISNRWRRRCAIAVSIITGIGKGNIMQ
jgi:hypothetical protein